MIFPKNIIYKSVLYLPSFNCIIKIYNNHIYFVVNEVKYDVPVGSIINIVCELNDENASLIMIAEIIKVGIGIYFNKSDLSHIIEMNPNNIDPALNRIQCAVTKDIQLEIANITVNNKINNQLILVGLRYIELHNYQGIRTLMLHEGRVGKKYFRLLFKDHNWNGRKARLKGDVNNLLLDISYHYLYILVNSIVRVYNLHPQIGYLHQYLKDRNSLSLDLMEVFRPDMDRLVIKYLESNKYSKSNFVIRKDKYIFKNSDFSHEFVSIVNKQLSKLKYPIAKYVYEYQVWLRKTNTEFPTYQIKI